ncbi:hypothetical protein GOV09_00065 [Candidatus Woesearchaeota archaeon]|nr:hypothetical protein [Candidatus Woesearchaeota archaeon]
MVNEAFENPSLASDELVAKFDLELLVEGAVGSVLVRTHMDPYGRPIQIWGKVDDQKDASKVEK